MSCPEKALSIHHYYNTIFTIFRNGQKSTKKAKTPKKYTRYSVEKIKLDHQHHTNQEHCLERDTPFVTKWGWEERVAFLKTSYCSVSEQEIKTKNVEVFLWSAFEPRLLVSNLALS